MIQYQQYLTMGANAFIVCLGFVLCAVGAVLALSLVCSLISGLAKLLKRASKGE